MQTIPNPQTIFTVELEFRFRIDNFSTSDRVCVYFSSIFLTSHAIYTIYRFVKTVLLFSFNGNESRENCLCNMQLNDG